MQDPSICKYAVPKDEHPLEHLARRKHGQVEVAENLQMRMGTHLEPLVGQLYAELMAPRVRIEPAGNMTVFTNDDIPSMAVTLDFWAYEESQPRWIVETKSTASTISDKEGKPNHKYFASHSWQVRAQMSVTEVTLGVVAALHRCFKPDFQCKGFMYQPDIHMMQIEMNNQFYREVIVEGGMPKIENYEAPAPF